MRFALAHTRPGYRYSFTAKRRGPRDYTNYRKIDYTAESLYEKLLRRTERSRRFVRSFVRPVVVEAVVTSSENSITNQQLQTVTDYQTDSTLARADEKERERESARARCRLFYSDSLQVARSGVTPTRPAATARSMINRRSTTKTNLVPDSMFLSRFSRGRYSDDHLYVSIPTRDKSELDSCKNNYFTFRSHH